MTDQIARIPAATPPIEGIATVIAHAIQVGIAGNISAKAINTSCCAPSVLAVNLAAFQGGADARDYTYLTQSDIDAAIQSLKNHLTPQMQQTIQAEVTQGESLVNPTCIQTVNEDHTAGDETLTATVMLTEQCNSVTYQSSALENQAAQMITSIAQSTLDSHYSFIGSIQVTIHHATMQDRKRSRAAIALTISGTWVYAHDTQSQEYIKKIIAGKTKQEALHLLASLPGIEQASISWGDDTKLPKNGNNIHFHFIVQSS